MEQITHNKEATGVAHHIGGACHGALRAHASTLGGCAQHGGTVAQLSTLYKVK